MKKLFHLINSMFLTVILGVMILSSNISAQNYPLVTLHDINYIADSLLPSFPPSPLAGDTVRLRGVVMVRTAVGSEQPGVGDRRPVIWAGARWTCYIQDKDNPEWGGIQIIQNDTTKTNAQQTLFDLADSSTAYEFPGVIAPDFHSTQCCLITTPNPIPIDPFEVLPHRPEPLVIPMDSLFA